MTSSWISNGIGIIATIVYNAGHKVKVIDNNTINKFYNDKNILKIIKKFKPDILAYSITIYNAYATYEQIKKIKSLFPNLMIIGGGIHMKYNFKEALENGADVVVNIEGEKVILPLLKHLETYREDYKKNLYKVKGVSFIKENGDFHFAKEFPVLKNLDEVPVVNYRLFNLEDFVKNNQPESDVFVITGQRGCPFGCKFCSDEIQRKDKRAASAKWMFENVKDLVDNYNAKEIFIADNNITILEERLRDFCELIINSGYNKKVVFQCQTTIRMKIKEDLISLMKDAGFIRIVFGIERLTDYSLQMINKKQSMENLHEIFSLCKKYKIEPSVFMMIGFPFENKELLEEEKVMFSEILKYTKELHLSILVPMKGTCYYDDYPRIEKWYLDKKEYNLRKAYFNNVLDIPIKHTIKKNFFDLSEETQKAMLDYYFTFKTLTGKRGKLRSVLYSIDYLTGRLSQQVFYISPSLEFFIFNKLRILRHNFGRRIAAR